MKKPLRILLTVILTIIAVPLVLLMLISLLFGFANRTNGRLLSSGEMRKYLLYVPPSYDASRATPLIINLHGFAQWPANQANVSQWNELADEEGFIVVYPQGSNFPLRWRLRTANPDSFADAKKDVTFISDLIDELSAKYTIDPERIYASGLSNGAGMSFMLACDLSERITAIGGVAGAYVTPFASCHPTRTVPLIAFHGKADPIVPFNGGATQPEGSRLPDIPQWVEAYAQLNGCQLKPEIILQSGAIEGFRYSSCKQTSEVIFYTIEDGGHSWPGGGNLPKWIVGKTTQEIDATRLMWEFFKQYSLE